MAQAEYFGKSGDEIERMKRIDRLDVKFTDGLILIQGVDQRISALEKSIKEIQSMLKGFHDVHEKSSKSIEKLSLKVNSPAPVQNTSAVSKITEKLAEQNSSLQQLSEAMRLANEQVALLKNQVQTHCLRSDLDSQKYELQKFIADTKSDISLIKGRLQGHEETIAQIALSADSVEQKTRDLKSVCDNLIAAEDSFTSSLENLKEVFANRIDTMHRSLQNYVTATIKEKLPSLDLDKIVATTRDQIKKEIDLIATDASNASLKYNNVSAEINIITKKIENIYLLIRKLEISKDA
jgi:chromosome segregation ATPase